MVKLLHGIQGLYDRYRLLMWLSGLLGGVGLPVLGWGVYALKRWADVTDMMVDNPEGASTIVTDGLFTWFFDAGGVGGRLLGFLFLFGVVFLVGLIVLQVLGFVASRTRVSGVDGEMEREDRRAERMRASDGRDDYGGEIGD